MFLPELHAHVGLIGEVFTYPSDLGINIQHATLFFRDALFRPMPERNVPYFNHLLTIDQT